MNSVERVEIGRLTQLLPMGLTLSAAGVVVSVGATLRRIIGERRHFDEIFTIDRPKNVSAGFAALRPCLGRADRLALRPIAHPQTVLRGSGILLEQGGAFLNLGFGVGLPEAVRLFRLTDADFSPSELAMELLFLHEANSAVQNELARFNLHLEEARKAAEVQAYTDPLTSLYNRRGMDVALNTALLDCGSMPFAVAHVDLDLFKKVNDSLGHAAGDLVLQSVAKILRSEIRSCDTAARVGGDEFVLILPGPGVPAALASLARRIIDRIEEPLSFEGQPIRISASIGMAISSQYAEPNSVTMLADADSALYHAKRLGRGRAELYRRPSGRVGVD